VFIRILYNLDPPDIPSITGDTNELLASLDFRLNPIEQASTRFCLIRWNTLDIRIFQVLIMLPLECIATIVQGNVLKNSVIDHLLQKIKASIVSIFTE
jgi:hypothetical protein